MAMFAVCIAMVALLVWYMLLGRPASPTDTWIGFEHRSTGDRVMGMVLAQDGSDLQINISQFSNSSINKQISDAVTFKMAQAKTTSNSTEEDSSEHQVIGGVLVGHEGENLTDASVYYSRTQLLFMIVSVLMDTPNAIFYTVGTSMVSGSVGNEVQGTAIALRYACGSLAGLPGPCISGWMLASAGFMKLGLLQAALLTGGAICVMLCL
eukprot:gnl/TRDRNA2_/TRDRNA2_153817_c1_seq1.p1 gnl/TRDRNA2_/TRDRNA2_153817_c1~~gnl/TRDRNA2_/TRDRNA2_153817_c1_seq1.p1  ORF type:complete len:209 (+),score=25.01 gnl/TRDRNA2_/TRDRNA2_153817_c1_seq1:2-628(+)